MSITSVLGHIMGLEFDESYQKWSSCRPEELFNAPIKKEVNIIELLFIEMLFCLLGCTRYAKY